MVNTVPVILLVDDEDGLRENLRSLLELEGFIVIEAKSGNEALAKYNTHADKIKVVLSDMRMADGDGAFFLKTLNSLGSQKQTLPPVYFMTGFTNHNKADLIRLGAQKIYKKPQEIITLVDDLKELYLN